MAQFPANIDVSSLNGTTGFKLNDGRSVSSAGDVNGDGFDDLIVGARGADPNGNGSGASYVVFGKAAGFGAALELSSLDGNNGFQINGEAAADRSGYSVSSAGDVNGDGFADIIVGADQADPNGGYSGASYVVFGTDAGFSAALELSGLDGNNGFQISGEAAYDVSGRSVSSAGDVNGDGFDDVIVGARGPTRMVVFRAHPMWCSARPRASARRWSFPASTAPTAFRSAARRHLTSAAARPPRPGT